jgi:hypothetical protein
MVQMIRMSIKAVTLGGLLGILAGCSSLTTYGTGVDPGTQTLRDVAGLIDFSPNRKEKIEYQERAGIVAPPNSALPQPEADSQVAANFPVDPEVRRRQIQQQADEARANGDLVAYDPYFVAAERKPNEASTGITCDESDPICMYRKVQAAKDTLKPGTDGRTGSVDENGAPVRKFLVEPPDEYRQPSPDAPVEITEERQKETGGLLSRLWPF